MSDRPFPVTEAAPIVHNTMIPASADVVVVGGGIIGLMTAWFIAEAGQSVVVLEKGRVAGEQSSRNWGWIRNQGRDAGEIPIMAESHRIWAEIAPQLDTDIGLRQEGTLYVARSGRALGRYEDWLRHARAWRLDSRIVTPAEVQSLLPGAADCGVGGLYTPSDMKAEPHIAVPALARAAVARGVQIVENCAVRDLDVAGGRIAGVVTERGRIAASEVAVAGGAWSSLLLRRVGVHIPQLAVRSSVARTSAFQAPAGQASTGLFAFRRRLDGGVTLAPSDVHDFYIGPAAFRNFRAYLPQLRRDFKSTKLVPWGPAHYPDSWTQKRNWSADDVSPFEVTRVLNPAPNMSYLNAALDRLNAMFPAAAPIRIEQAWAGMIDTMPDVVPVIDRAVSLPGLTIATGMCGHGFGIGPGVGRVTADLVLNNAPRHDLSRFCLSRFSDGSRVDFGSAL
ncbi:FAD dependent oxidoreductase [Ketogulonicigenium robustum]|uniref:FAD dependent oxidoreductase n=1 Tax=Ketogulonicigenium robustum TaxID=92947 RepID=A0A1W6P018_9RHOB|nr:FAD-dependent oxidoreductase [Ketogulonicigenium robustum]ARO14789.1 FAD dependent oxidoreductase [Ketogulonicigenium robustum]